MCRRTTSEYNAGHSTAWRDPVVREFQMLKASTFQPPRKPSGFRKPRPPEVQQLESCGGAPQDPGRLDRGRSRLYRDQLLQVNMRLKALAEIYTMHSFAPFLESIIENWGKKTWPKQPPPLSHRSLIAIFRKKITCFC